MENILVRKAVESDIPRLEVLYKELHEHHICLRPDNYKEAEEEYYYKEVETTLKSEYFEAFVYDDGEIKGFVFLYKPYDYKSPSKFPRTTITIENFFVEEKYRGSGIGRALFEYVRSYAAENGCTHIQLTADTYNKGALEFYEKMGLSPCRIILETKTTEEQENEK